MKNNFILKILMISFSAFFSLSTYAYKISIYTDQTNTKTAREVIKEFKKTYPFNTFEIDFEVVKVEPSALDCPIMNNIKRLPVCDTTKINKDSAKRGSDQAMIIKQSNTYGGSGGGVPTITTATPARTLLHEYLHTLGFKDEYKYSNAECKFYCAEGSEGANVAVITPNPNGYSDDSSARGQHSGKISWNDLILPTTQITRQQGHSLSRSRNAKLSLGTGNAGSGRAKLNNGDQVNRNGKPIGLYQGKSCANAIPPMATWQPGAESSIMEDLKAGLGSGVEQMVTKILISRGAKQKNNAHSQKVLVNNLKVGRAIPINNDLPPPSVNDTNHRWFKPRDEENTSSPLRSLFKR
jgi:hypothetical protein